MLRDQQQALETQLLSLFLLWVWRSIAAHRVLFVGHVVRWVITILKLLRVVRSNYTIRFIMVQDEFQSFCTGVGLESM